MGSLSVYSSSIVEISGVDKFSPSSNSVSEISGVVDIKLSSESLLSVQMFLWGWGYMPGSCSIE